MKEIAMPMRHLFLILAFSGLLMACGQSYDEHKRVSRAERIQRMKEDSAALKIAVMPTLDCLPLYVAQKYGLFETLGADVRLKYFTAQMDCDTALVGGTAEGAVTDLVRAGRLVEQGLPLTYKVATGAYWQLVTNRNARVKELKQLDDKMVAMTRYSATALLADYAVDSAKVKDERVFRIQVNDVTVRLQMLLNNAMDALVLPEPQATAARIVKSRVLLDSRELDMKLGIIAFRKNIEKDENRRKQLDVFIKAYNMACDSINKKGIAHYRDLVTKYCRVRPNVVDSLPAGIRFNHAVGPRQTDIEAAGKWLARQ
jgi:NitT/TauT family transport system substrate-binding protein